MLTILKKVSFTIVPNDVLMSEGPQDHQIDIIFLSSTQVDVNLELEFVQNGYERQQRRTVRAYFVNGVKTLELYGRDKFEVGQYYNLYMNSGCGFYRDGKPIFLANTLWKKDGIFGNK